MPPRASPEYRLDVDEYVDYYYRVYRQVGVRGAPNRQPPVRDGQLATSRPPWACVTASHRPHARAHRDVLAALLLRPGRVEKSIPLEKVTDVILRPPAAARRRRSTRWRCRPRPTRARSPRVVTGLPRNARRERHLARPRRRPAARDAHITTPRLPRHGGRRREGSTAPVAPPRAAERGADGDARARRPRRPGTAAVALEDHRDGAEPTKRRRESEPPRHQRARGPGCSGAQRRPPPSLLQGGGHFFLRRQRHRHTPPARRSSPSPMYPTDA